MAIEPMVSCTLSDVSYIYPHKHDVQFISTPSWFVWGSFLSMLLVFVNIFRGQHIYAAMLKKSVIGNFKDTCCKVDFEF